MNSDEAAYRDACSSGKLPGVVLLAADKEGMSSSPSVRLVNTGHNFAGAFEYRKAMGFRSLKPENAAKAIEPDTVLAMGSCTNLMTGITVCGTRPLRPRRGCCANPFGGEDSRHHLQS